MRMATFNILHGRSVQDGAVELGRLEESVRRLDADVLALQEVDLDQPRSAMADLTAVAAEAMGAVAHRFVAAISGTPGATWMAATGHEQPGTAAYGIALLSRFPVRNWQVLRLPRIPMPFPMYLREPGKALMVREEPRAAVLAQLDTPLGPMTVANTHLSFVPGWNRVQLHRLVRDLRGFAGPRVLMGDLNMTAPKVGRWHALRPLALAPTFPAEHPDRQLDHILADDPALRADHCLTPMLPISDHRALVVEVSTANHRSQTPSA
ncbi:endonuclease [Mycolicibacterium moriokaense]|nr:endonuclease [Mycolicibacterium moriokaense]